MAGERVALFGRPRLLVTRLATVVFGEWCHCTRPLRVVCLEVALVDAPATPRRNIAVVSLDRILLEPPITGEMSGVLSEDTFIEVFEGGLSVGIVGDDPSPVVATAVASGPFSESLEFACRVASIVSALATAAFPLIQEVPLEGTREPRRTTACR